MFLTECKHIVIELIRHITEDLEMSSGDFGISHGEYIKIMHLIKSFLEDHLHAQSSVSYFTKSIYYFLNNYNKITNLK